VVSTLLYSAITSARKTAPAASGDVTGGGQAPPLGKYVDSLAALVPAEVLAAHAAILGFTTTASPGAGGQSVTVITDPGVLQGSFWALVALAGLLYGLGQWGHWKPTDFVRMCIPPLAFVGWTMLQRSTAFDAIAPSWNMDAREATAIIGAIVLAALATLVAYKLKPD
jgi:hypothetical protein